MDSQVLLTISCTINSSIFSVSVRGDAQWEGCGDDQQQRRRAAEARHPRQDPALRLQTRADCRVPRPAWPGGHPRLPYSRPQRATAWVHRGMRGPTGVGRTRREQPPAMKASHARRADRRQPSPADAPPPEPDDPASAEALAARDRIGWPPHSSERRDFYHRIRVFPPEMAGWRKRMVREIAADPARFPSAAGATPDEIQARFDDGISYLREVARILAVLYGTPDLGNKPDPTDELVYINTPAASLA